MIEHGNLIDEPTAKLMAEKGMFMVANLVTYYAMRERAAEFGMTGDMLAKNDLVIDGGLRSLEICKRAGVPVGYGTDLLGALQVEESREFLIRSEVLSPIEIIRAGHDRRRADRPAGGQARHAEGRRLRGPAADRRRSA